MRVLRLLPLAIVGAAVVFAFTGRWPWARPGAAPIPSVPAPQVTVSTLTDTLRRGETLGVIFARHGLSSLDVATLGSVLDARRLRAGLAFSFHHENGDTLPAAVSVRTSEHERLTLHRVSDGWTAERVTIPWTATTLGLSARIDRTLYDAVESALPPGALPDEERNRVAWGIADVFAWQVDFSRDIQRGDAVRVLLEREVSDEDDVRFGRVLAAEVTLSGTKLSAVRYTDASGRTDYYDAEGRGLQRAFLLAPVEFRRVSSGYNRARLHPILGIVRRHEGVDFAAAPGTPVMAVGDGIVVRAGWAGGYGNLVELRHRGGVTTRYAHLRAIAKGLRAGSRVTQSQVIGFVGSTGLSSGPHLHYEFRMNGVSRDPRKVNPEAGRTLTGAELEAFRAERDRLLARLPAPAPLPGTRLD